LSEVERCGRSFFDMVTVDRAGGDQTDALEKTLGDVIFSDGTSPAAETEWVDLVRAISGGDKRALSALFARTHKIVFTLVMRLTRDRETAEELTLDVFHDVWRRAGTYDASNGSVIGWVLNQARSRAIDRLRFEHRKKRIAPSAQEADGDGIAAGPHEAAESEQQERRLRGAIATLGVHEREAIEMAFFGGLTHVEMAAHLDEPLGTVKTRIRTSLEKLRRALGEGVER
jgi:RNA polymerase sigma-70 factor, ECF subfamily